MGGGHRRTWFVTTKAPNLTTSLVNMMDSALSCCGRSGMCILVGRSTRHKTRTGRRRTAPRGCQGESDVRCRKSGGAEQVRPGEGSERNGNTLSFRLLRAFDAGTEAVGDGSRRVCLTRAPRHMPGTVELRRVGMQRAGVGAAHSRAGHDQREGCAGGRGVRRRRLSKHWHVVYTHST
jgi:hypothetical protein